MFPIWQRHFRKAIMKRPELEIKYQIYVKNKAYWVKALQSKQKGS